MISSRSAQSHPPTSASQSIEAVRKRARHRLIGAAVLVLAGVVLFPLLFDTQPRPIPVDIPIEIPAKTGVEIRAGADASAAAAAGSRQVSKRIEVAPEAGDTEAQNTDIDQAKVASLAGDAGLGEREEMGEPANPAPAASPAPAEVAVPTETVQTPAMAAKPELPAPKPIEPAAKKPVDAPTVASAPQAAATERLVVQVGAFAEAGGARDVRNKLDRAGIKTYTQVAKTADGERTRVRLGPFANRAEAERAAERVKKLGLPAAILTL